jgi:hypothetical protein
MLDLSRIGYFELTRSLGRQQNAPTQSGVENIGLKNIAFYQWLVASAL